MQRVFRSRASSLNRRDWASAFWTVFAVALVAVAGTLAPKLLAQVAPASPEKSSSAKPGAAQAKAAENAPAVIRRRVLVVNVPVTVLDKRGFPVIDLSQNQFEVFEDGKRQNISYFHQEPLPPLRIGLVLDTSNSMRMLMQYEKDAASGFVYNMLEGDNTRNQIFLETFDESNSIIQSFTANPDALDAKIRPLKAGGGKAMYDAIYAACETMLKSGPAEGTRRVIVLISDGLDVQSTHTIDEVISMAHRAETSIYTIGNSPYGFSNPGDKYLKQLAGETGGWSFFPLEKEVGADLATGYLAHGTINPEGYENMGLGAATGIYTAQQLEHISDALENLGRQLDSQYSIGYTPTDQNLNGTYRRIHVVVLRKDVRVRSKTGYFALAQP
ncbi:MAG: VWA domain-containing protein [Terriglobia bacterium]